MAALIRHLRSMKGLGILADLDGQPPHLQFRKLNLVYGFNGSGKSTLSRLFASLQTGARHRALPEHCSFELELDDSNLLSCPGRLDAIQQRVLVFNADFIEDNLQWSTARANPVFYIGKAQKELGEQLKKQQEESKRLATKLILDEKSDRDSDKALASFRRTKAREIADQLRLRNRKYEANHLAQDYASIEHDADSVLTNDKLDSFVDISRKDDPPEKIEPITLPIAVNATHWIAETHAVCASTPSSAMLQVTESHPEMLMWIREGLEYHASHSLHDCLFCGNSLSDDRKEELRAAFDGGIAAMLTSIDECYGQVDAIRSILRNAKMPALLGLSLNQQLECKSLLDLYQIAINEAQKAIDVACTLLEQKRKNPTTPITTDSLPQTEGIASLLKGVEDAENAINKIIREHNSSSDDFVRVQEDARTAIKRHYLAINAEEHSALLLQRAFAIDELDNTKANIESVRRNIQGLESQIREHGPAAEVINRLLHSYLGHPELSIVTNDSGYEFHRHGKLIKGLPSEGEKTAIALCYFLSMIDAEGRKLGELIVVVDDPISSLDSRSLNFACNLIKSRLTNSAQLFVLTHNQNCVNEFRKHWKSKAKPTDGKEPTAALLFLDVTLPKGAQSRTTRIIELPKLLREYDSEYHYLFQHVLRFLEMQDEYDYAYMMPNVLRRVLEVFLAFKCPGSSPLSSKIDQLCKLYPDLDKDKIVALERLSQIESHSDSLDDLISFSSMVLEESQAAGNALVALMEEVDRDHVKGLRNICT